MSKKGGAAGGGIVASVMMLVSLIAFMSNGDVLGKLEDVRANGLPSAFDKVSTRIPNSAPSAIKLPEIKLPKPPTAAPAPKAKVDTITVAKAKADLNSLPVTSRAKVPGYDRKNFGSAWTDNNTARLGRNGCDTRNDVLSAQMKNATFKPGTRNCKVLTGVLADPYTAKTINFTNAKPSAVQIDHVAALSYAWDMGAAKWDSTKRVKFANDVDLNLMAVDGPTNGRKGDKGPGAWMPPNKAYHCGYAVKYVTVLKAYGLKLDRADKPALTAALATCR